MPRVRFTLQRLLVVVALVAVVLGGTMQVVGLKRRRDSLARRAWAWDARRDLYDGSIWELNCGRYAGDSTELGRSWGYASPTPEDKASLIPKFRAVADYCDGMRRKYERAAAYPWRPVEPDLPAPAVDELMRGVLSGQDIFKVSATRFFGTGGVSTK